jgi:hypothetical protein
VADKPQEPKQKTPAGGEIPIPTRGQFFANLDKLAQPTSTKMLRSRDGILIALSGIQDGAPCVVLGGGLMEPKQLGKYAGEIIAQLGAPVIVTVVPTGIELRPKTP